MICYASNISKEARNTKKRSTAEASPQPYFSFLERPYLKNSVGSVKAHFCWSSSFDQPPIKMDKGQKRMETSALFQLGFSGSTLSALLQYHINTIPEISHTIAM